MVNNPASPADRKKVLENVPQKSPFLFIDDIIEINDKEIKARYHLKEDEYFYKGHFPGNPITPGVILIEAMAQVSVVALGIYLLYLENRELEHITFFTESEVEFSSVVRPGSELTIYGEKIYQRRNKLKSRARIELADGTVAASGILAGVEAKL